MASKVFCWVMWYETIQTLNTSVFPEAAAKCEIVFPSESATESRVFKSSSKAHYGQRIQQNKQTNKQTNKKNNNLCKEFIIVKSMELQLPWAGHSI